MRPGGNCSKTVQNTPKNGHGVTSTPLSWLDMGGYGCTIVFSCRSKYPVIPYSYSKFPFPHSVL